MIARFWLWFSMTYNMNITEKAYDCSSGQIDHFFETEDVDIVLAGEGGENGAYIGNAVLLAGQPLGDILIDLVAVDVPGTAPDREVSVGGEGLLPRRMEQEERGRNTSVSSRSQYTCS